jgi:multiple sugar transport system permease protein
MAGTTDTTDTTERRGAARRTGGAGDPGTRGRRARWAVIDLVVVLYALLPVLWTVSLSLKDPATIADGELVPREWTLANYAGILTNGDFIRGLVNSIGIGLISTLIAVVFGTMAAYAVARVRFAGKRTLIGLALLIAMFPQISLVTPLFQIERTFGIFNTWPGLIFPYVTFALPLTIYTLSAFFREIPWELEKAAKMDGATTFQAFRQVIAPLAAPGVVTTAILAFILCWNDFLFAISLTSSNAARTAPATIASFTGSTQFEDPTGSISAAAVVITIPIVLFVLVFQRRIVSGLTSGAVKG